MEGSARDIGLLDIGGFRIFSKTVDLGVENLV